MSDRLVAERDAALERAVIERERCEDWRRRFETLAEVARETKDECLRARARVAELEAGVRSVVGALDDAFSLNSARYMGTQLGAAHREARALLDGGDR
jgi:hypothetical protein